MDFKLVLNKKQRGDLVELKKNAQEKKDKKRLQEIEGIELLYKGYSIRTVAEANNVCTKTVRNWVKKFLLNVYSDKFKAQPTGRPSQLSSEQKEKLFGIIVAGPEASGFSGACWRSPMVQQLIKKEFDITYSVKYIPELLQNIGLSYQRASFIASQRDDAARESWLSEIWLEIIDLQKTKNAYLLFGDECSFAQWGTQSYTWAPKGFTPLVQNGGSRKNYKVFGAIDYETGRFFSRTTDGRLNANSYIEFLRHILNKTKKHVILIQLERSYPMHTSF